MDNNLDLQLEKFSKQVAREKKWAPVKTITSQTILYIVLTIAAIISIFPFVFMVLSSFMSDMQYRNFTNISDIMPQPWVFSNYADALAHDITNGVTFGVVLTNTILTALTSTILGMVVLILAAFAFARLEFKGKDAIFGLLLLTMMIPGELFTITNYTTIFAFKLNGTLTALIVPFMVSVYYIYLLRNNFKQVPEELYKAAKVDGVGDFKYLLTVMIPLAAPTLISIFILKIIAVWNSYIWPNLVNAGSSALLISNWMATAGRPANGSSEVVIPIKMAAAIIVTLPLLIVFICFRKYIMRGVSKSGIKG